MITFPTIGPHTEEFFRVLELLGLFRTQLLDQSNVQLHSQLQDRIGGLRYDQRFNQWSPLDAQLRDLENQYGRQPVVSLVTPLWCELFTHNCVGSNTLSEQPGRQLDNLLYFQLSNRFRAPVERRYYQLVAELMGSGLDD